MSLCVFEAIELVKRREVDVELEMTDTSASARKRLIAVRATPRQIETLQNAFASSTATSKDLLKRLSDETGLYVCGPFHPLAQV